MSTWKRATGIGLGGLLLAAAAVAGTDPAGDVPKVGTELVIESVRIGAEASPERSTVFTDGHRMRLDLAGGRRTLLHLPAQGRVIAIDHKKHTYVAIDRSQAVAVASSVGRVGEELRSRAATLPEGAREAAQELVEGALGPAPDRGPGYTLRDLPERDVVSGVPCRERELLRGEQRLAELCEARPADAGPAAAALGPLRDLAALTREVAPLLPGSMRDEGLGALDLMDQVEGVPMRVRTYEGDREDREARIVESKRVTLQATVFEVPPDYAPEINITVRDHLGGP